MSEPAPQPFAAVDAPRILDAALHDDYREVQRLLGLCTDRDILRLVVAMRQVEGLLSVEALVRLSPRKAGTSYADE